MKNEVNKFNEAIDELMNGLVKETVCNSESLKYMSTDDLVRMQHGQCVCLIGSEFQRLSPKTQGNIRR